MGLFLNPFTDFGFKKLFGEEASKEILLDFLNEVLREDEGEIKSIEFKRTEQLGDLQLDRKAIFDLYCENEKGEKFIVEMQKAKIDFFKDRSIFYSTFPIREQADKGNWNFRLKAVYTIAILDFVFEEDKNDQDKMIYHVQLSDTETHKVFYDKLTFIYLEMPKFKKSLDECTTHFERWLYVLRNMSRLERYPEQLQEKIFEKLFDKATIANLTKVDLDAYDRSLKYYWDLNAVIETAHGEGFEEGVVKGIAQGEQMGRHAEKVLVAKNLLKKGFSNAEIAEVTGLLETEIQSVRDSI